MTPSSPRASNERDPLDQPTDPALARLVADLDTLYTSSRPPADLAPAIDHALRAQAVPVRRAVSPARPRWADPAVWLPRRAIAITGALMVAVLVLTAGVYGGALLNSIFPPHLDAQDVHLAETVDGFTITVERAYADANRIIIGYTVSTPPGHTYRDAGPGQITLTTQDGLALAAYRQAFGADDLSRGMGARVESFDAAAITGNPATIQLQLVYRDFTAIQQDASSATVQQQVDIPGPWTFTFSLAFHPGRVAIPHQTVYANGVPLTLERVVITPSEARAYVRGAGYDTIATLANGSWSMESSPIPFPTAGVATYIFQESVFERHGTWTLTVALDARPYEVTNRPIPPSWTFRFDVP